ncbi:C-Myc-binding protein [Plasmodium brasilianum]|uniref:c-Myc-binding protein, putative n=2 Tax=Plasmodium (Plasmodium) TaxID=418103 RepID=A0A1A8WPT6_PLAMA|nr:C-Myc-binding protein, putative [Plasmodium malariae]KAI4834786.1 C-Myc-binding protein [Plasmodium brasilianum]SBS94291.1 C-Myc-binding protein, putative (MYCBP) [Plasmodium malariae]SCP03344.1 C-Myc-binding protein, putative [Plasmodium malariae]
MSAPEGINHIKDDFIRYLEEHEVINHISRVLLKLFEEKEKPNDAIKFIREHLYNAAVDVSIDDLKRENTFLRQENQKLTKKFEELNDTLKKLVHSQGGLDDKNITDDK